MLFRYHYLKNTAPKTLTCVAPWLSFMIMVASSHGIAMAVFFLGVGFQAKLTPILLVWDLKSD